LHTTGFGKNYYGIVCTDDAFICCVRTEVVVCSYLNFRQNAYKKNMEYLCWVCDPESSGGVNDATRILEEGFLSSDVYEV